MLRYITRRILLFIPTFFIITLLSFCILHSAPGDPIDRLVTAAQGSGDVGAQTLAEQEQRDYWTHRLGLDLPVFYFTLHSLAEPDTLYRVADKKEREALSDLINRFGNWPEILQYRAALSDFWNSLDAVKCDTTAAYSSACDSFRTDWQAARFEAASLPFISQPELIASRLGHFHSFFSGYSLNTHALDKLENDFTTVIQHDSKWKNYIPVLSFHPDNQYHRWLFGDSRFTSGLLAGDFGISYISKQPVSKLIAGRIGWSLFFTLFSVFLAYLVSIPVAIKAASKKNSTFDRTSSLVFFMLYSLPTFWMATLLLMTFCNTDVLSWFPASGVMPVTGYPADAGVFEKIKLSLPYLVLPTFCYTYSSFAFLSRILRVSMIEIMNQDFIRTARAKGLSERKVLWKHALRNSLLPVITVFANVFPFMIGGSVILESIFTIPGMGTAIYNSIDAQDYPVIVAVFTLTGILTMIGYLLSDLLYAAADPRISFQKPKGI